MDYEIRRRLNKKIDNGELSRVPVSSVVLTENLSLNFAGIESSGGMAVLVFKY